MHDYLAFAERADSADTNLAVVLLCVAIIGATAVLASVPICIAWARRSRGANAITPAAVVWGLLAAGSATSTVITQMKWSHERQLRIESGYYNFEDDKNVPALPWALWGVLAASYAGIVAWPLSKQKGQILRKTSG